ncbi:rho GTPase-activating 44-like isoform X1 [Labeo rohita]|uniref:Rho GTPase-activating 44-like isoform X1 n=1 Tax=Labeo rohita TaxID=84645 RepID=A0A498L777_LABRO|nr:rho GTPase-activating 44-like isoform X1 [Labeo rohita]RXN27438.1 rho GTPase-activating 44-like isoform X1 [Labeo rohita]RXN35837.1 rho GTPase-activating 44-like isoform X1 [Labeo rohita]
MAQCDRIPVQNARKQSDVPLSCCKTHSTPFADFASNSGLETEIAFCFLSPCVVFNILIIAISIVSLCTVNLSCCFTFVAIALISHDTIADLFSLEIPSINVNLDSLLDEFRVVPCRSSFAAVSSPEGESVSEEEGQSTTL